MTLDQLNEVRCRAQLATKQDKNDYMAWAGTRLAGYLHVPLTVKNILMLGPVAYECLPATAEESVSGLLNPLADMPEAQKFLN